MSAALATMRRLHCAKLPNVAEVRRNRDEGPVTTEKGLRCRVAIANQPRQRDEAGRSAVVSEFDLSLGDPAREPAALDVLPGDLIRVEKDPWTYRVIRTDKGASEAVLLTCRCVRPE